MACHTSAMPPAAHAVQAVATGQQVAVQLVADVGPRMVDGVEGHGSGPAVTAVRSAATGSEVVSIGWSTARPARRRLRVR